MIIPPQANAVRTNLPLATKAGTQIQNLQKLEQPAVALAAAVALFQRERPDAWLRSSTATYNCIGMMFASRRAWVDPDQVNLILREDGFRQLAGQAQAVLGDVVLYTDAQGNLTHAGIVVSNTPVVSSASWNTMVLSKWGLNGEYLHPVAYVPPLLGSPTQYWSERKP